MEQFFDNRSMSLRQSLLERLGLSARKPELEATTAPNPLLPSCHTSEQLPASDVTPSTARLLSRDGQPTFVSIRRAVLPRPGISEEVHFCASHNEQGCRHTLTYSLSTLESGDLALLGRVEQLGHLPVLPGPFGDKTARDLLSFELEASHTHRGHVVLLLKDAHMLAEVFADEGVTGVHDYLERRVRAIGSTQARLIRCTGFDQLFFEASDAHTTWHDQLDYPQSSKFTSEEYESIERVDDALSVLDSISSLQFSLRRDRPDFLDMLESFSEEEQTDQGMSYDTLRVKMRFPSLRLWATFVTPETPAHKSALLSLRLPFGVMSRTDDLRHLKLEVAGPRNFFGLRERYSVRDRDDVLEVTQYSCNDSLFRNVLGVLHRVNLSDSPGANGVRELRAVLDNYGLRTRPANVSAVVVTACKMLVSLLRPANLLHQDEDNFR